MKRAIKNVLLGSEPIAQFVPIGLTPGHKPPKVWLDGLAEPIDVSVNCVVAALRPLTFGMVVNPSLASLLERQKNLILHFREANDSGFKLGRIYLSWTRKAPLAGDYCLCLFETSGHSNYCVSALRLRMHYLYRWWLSRKSRNPYNFRMLPGEDHTLQVFYSRPRPVYFVSVVDGKDGNIFPMDLVGPTESPFFLLALRNTSPAVAMMKASRRIALSAVPLELQDVAYELGKHHKQKNVDWKSLPFETATSTVFRLPILADALGVRELEIQETHEIGSHCLFVAKTIYEEKRRDGFQFGHVQGFYHHFVARKAGPLPAKGAALG